MKKIFIILGLVFALLAPVLTPVYAAEDDPAEEPIIAEVLVAEDELILEEEEELFQAELSATIAEVFAWIGGFSGLGALLLFALRFIRERTVLRAIRDEVKTAKESGDSSAAAVNKLVEVVEAYGKHEQAMVKMIVGLIQVSDLHPEAKRQIIEGLQDDSITVREVFEAGLVHVDIEIEQNAQMKTEIKQTTESLLSKLAEKDEV